MYFMDMSDSCCYVWHKTTSIGIGTVIMYLKKLMAEKIMQYTNDQRECALEFDNL